MKIMAVLTSKQRQYLRGLAHPLADALQIGGHFAHRRIPRVGLLGEAAADDALQLRLGIGSAIHIDQRFGEKIPRRRTVWIEFKRSPQMFFRLLFAAAEKPWHLVVPAAERTIG